MQQFAHKSSKVPNLEGLIPLKGTLHSERSFLVILSRKLSASQILRSRICAPRIFGESAFPLGRLEKKLEEFR